MKFKTFNFLYLPIEGVTTLSLRNITESFGVLVRYLFCFTKFYVTKTMEVKPDPEKNT